MWPIVKREDKGKEKRVKKILQSPQGCVGQHQKGQHMHS